MIIGIVYKDWNYGGESWTLTADSGCADNQAGDWFLDTLTGGWERSISSLIPAGNCWMQLFEDPHYQGTEKTYKGSAPYVGDAMNDKARSVIWY
ncbi:peptidase inhibitor family I36 protein [Streptomyces spectabilis]|uniref:Uncharacterized protein n=1 Tax=Streptomyces spectabilis TaxID=68270 RepID=A0A7W8AZ78_STRST|nr:peptidase inhibitor family I36 protein [Streptomyces spectabilis]MBB5107283.1 hypothetical protein [Streptomyces spectabilis]MCI3899984.1 peptidase inhibitor family I36 protein [Streptomyces spectabilis]GGV36625.1 hypothetical protein GCM10010245_58310 [Streptomyces spectabilis]